MVQRPSNRRLEIFCDCAFVASDHDMSGPIVAQWGDGPEVVIAEDEVKRRFLALQPGLPEALHDWCGVPYLLQDYAFVDALLTDRLPAPSLAAGLEAQRLAAAVYHAARSGDEVDVQRFTGSA